jgi:hypothetical protein
MKTTNYYVTIWNTYEGADAPKVINAKLPIAYDDLIEAAEAGWAVVSALAAMYDLDYENQGDQYMAFYKEGHPQEGEGAFVVKVVDEEGKAQEL